MPNTHDRTANDFGKYDSMSTEELQQILRDDASNPEGSESDMEMLLYVMDVLAKRRQERNEGKSPEEALETFKQKYYTEDNHSFDSESVRTCLRKNRSIPWRKSLIAATIAIVLVIGGTFTANAAGFDIWEIIGKWTKETFHFGYAGTTVETNAPSADFEHPCASLQEALDQCNITVFLVPTWIPEGYDEADVKITQTPKQRSFAAKYTNGNDTIKIRIADYLDAFPSQIERNDDLIEVYSAGGTDYYIFKNHDQLKAVWITENYECYIIGPISLSEIKEMIDSILKG